MFDPESAALLRSAPAIPGLDAERLPALLTETYAQLVTARLRVGVGGTTAKETLAKIADTYELIAALSAAGDSRRASAFVAGTAQQILAKERPLDVEQGPPLGRDHVDPSISAALLFLAAEQFPDANEAASGIPSRREDVEISQTTAMLIESIQDLARGRLTSVLDRSSRRVSRPLSRLPVDGSQLLYRALLEGVELLASEVLAGDTFVERAGRFGSSEEAFSTVAAIASEGIQIEEGLSFVSTYPGPAHLAALLAAAGRTLSDCAVSNIPPPDGSDDAAWRRWLSHRASTKPYLWPNHREAIDRGFHLAGTSALLTIPTGGGKTTLSEFKIASALTRGESVIFLVPTHALADQLRDDLADAFPEDVIGGSVSVDFDMLLLGSLPLQRIEVMTPERCLALLTLAPDTIAEVGLLVFDECHMLSCNAGSLRRALDGMLCLLAFQKVRPEADLLFLSAMISEPGDFAAWIAEQTKRPCQVIDPVWKPSRQARGVVVYGDDELRLVTRRSNAARVAAGTKGVGKAALAELRAEPYVLFGLQHNWNVDAPTDISLNPLLGNAVPLAGAVGKTDNRIYATANANVVAAAIAIQAARRGIKTIIFSATATQTRSTARAIDKELGSIHSTDYEDTLWKALVAETGGEAHSLVRRNAQAHAHFADLLPIERKLVEAQFRRADGSGVIVATTTLSQGMNLPAEMAILAGDKRADLTNGGREALKAHEILNAAGRAGRAGHLANGVVILVSESILKFDTKHIPNDAAKKRLKAILPESDRCVVIDDPLQRLLDEIQVGAISQDAEYLLNRLQSDLDGGFDRAEDTLRRSFASFQARRKNDGAAFAQKLAAVRRNLDVAKPKDVQSILLEASSQSGLSPATLAAGIKRLQSTKDFPSDVSGWLGWTIDWLKSDPVAIEFLGSSALSLRRALGLKPTDSFVAHLDRLRAGLEKWILGAPLSAIEVALGGDIGQEPECWRARELATDLAPRGISFALGVVAHLARSVFAERVDADVDLPVLDYLATAVRRGFHNKEIIEFAGKHRNLLTRVDIHRAFEIHDLL